MPPSVHAHATTIHIVMYCHCHCHHTTNAFANATTAIAIYLDTVLMFFLLNFAKKNIDIAIACHALLWC